jgi:hypothetical protein
MAPRLEDLEKILTANGIACDRSGEFALTARIPTKFYKDSSGKLQIQVMIRMDDENHCLVMETHWAFDTKQTVHKEAMLSCLMGAAFRTPLIRTQHDPRDGEVRLRVDSILGEEGISGENVVRLVQAIPAFADTWYPEIKSAMTKGTFDLDRPAKQAATPSLIDDQRLAAIATRAGGVKRLKVLLAFRNARRRGESDQDADGTGPPEAGTDPSRN